jgi:hypothetical protein
MGDVGWNDRDLRRALVLTIPWRDWWKYGAPQVNRSSSKFPIEDFPYRSKKLYNYAEIALEEFYISRWYLAWLIRPWEWRRHIPPKLELTFNGLQSSRQENNEEQAHWKQGYEQAWLNKITAIFLKKKFLKPEDGQFRPKHVVNLKI